MKRTLLDDIKKVYFSIECITEDNTICTYCGYCKNKSMCKMIENLIKSMKEFY